MYYKLYTSDIAKDATMHLAHVSNNFACQVTASGLSSGLLIMTARTAGRTLSPANPHAFFQLERDAEAGDK
jgi:hypothetical protein